LILDKQRGPKAGEGNPAAVIEAIVAGRAFVELITPESEPFVNWLLARRDEMPADVERYASRIIAALWSAAERQHTSAA
jgi:hypothetical protein